MTNLSLSRHVPFPVEQISHVVGDVAAYQDFLPLVRRSTVSNMTTHADGRVTFDAEITIAYKKLGINETMTSNVVIDPVASTVTSRCSNGPVTSLVAEWKMVRAGQEGTEIQFTIDYTLKSRSLQFLISGMFDMMLRKILAAFEQRARKLYGSIAA